MTTECTAGQLEFHAPGSREVVGRFDGGRVTTDGGGVLLREDLNDHDVLRADSALALLVGKSDVTGERRVRERDKGCPLAGSSTLNHLELSDPASAAGSRYKKIAADPQALDRVLVEVFLDSYHKPPREIWLDLDATDDPLHGHQ